MSNRGTITMPTMTATSELGTLAPSAPRRGHKNSTARHTAPTRSACQLKVPKFAASAETLSAVSTVAVPAGYVSPKKSFSWPMTMVTAIPAVKPVVMVYGTKRMMVPSLSKPITTSSTPAISVAATRPSMPSVATMPATMVANAAVGPEICTREPPRNAIRKPATMAVYKPCSGPTPEAIASAIESGSATMATTMPDTMSRGSCSLSSSLLECLMMLNRIGLILSRCKGSQFLFVVYRLRRARRPEAKAALPR